MTQRREIEPLLDHWFQDGPSNASDRVLDVVTDRIWRQSQRPAWRIDWRRPFMHPNIKVAASIAAVIVIALVGYNLLPGSSGIGGFGPAPTPVVTPAPTASPSPSPTPTPFPCEQATPCAGDLTAGHHRTSAFQPAVGYDVPVNWTNPRDKTNAYVLHAPSAPDHYIALYSHVAIPAQDTSCKVTRKTGVGNGVADWVNFLTKHPGLHATTPQSLTVGGYPAVRVTFTVAATWTQTCPNSVGPAVVDITNDATVPAYKEMVDDQTTSLTIVGVPGQTVLIEVQTGGSADQDAVWNMVKPVIDTMTFTPAS